MLPSLNKVIIIIIIIITDGMPFSFRNFRKTFCL